MTGRDPFQHFGHCRRHNSTRTLVHHVLMLSLRMLCDGLTRFVVRRRRSADLQSRVQSPLCELHDWLPSSRTRPCTTIEQYLGSFTMAVLSRTRQILRYPTQQLGLGWSSRSSLAPCFNPPGCGPRDKSAAESTRARLPRSLCCLGLRSMFHPGCSGADSAHMRVVTWYLRTQCKMHSEHRLAACG